MKHTQKEEMHTYICILTYGSIYCFSEHIHCDMLCQAVPEKAMYHAEDIDREYTTTTTTTTTTPTTSRQLNVRMHAAHYHKNINMESTTVAQHMYAFHRRMR